MDFPQWSLWGMGGASLLALLLLGLTLIILSPRTANQLGLDATNTHRRVQSLVGYAFAMLLVAFGFFIAGVPIGEQNETGEQGLVTATMPASTDEVTHGVGMPAETIPIIPSATLGESASGAFSEPLSRPATATPTLQSDETVMPDDVNVQPPTGTTSPSPTVAGTLPPTSTQTPSPTANSSPTPTPSSTPTISPTPTLTATPIAGKTATIDTNGSTLWIRRTPGGSPIKLINHGDTVIVLERRANQAGFLWQEIQTIEDAVSGWVRQEYLILDE